MAQFPPATTAFIRGPIFDFEDDGVDALPNEVDQAWQELLDDNKHPSRPLTEDEVREIWLTIESYRIYEASRAQAPKVSDLLSHLGKVEAAATALQEAMNASDAAKFSALNAVFVDRQSADPNSLREQLMSFQRGIRGARKHLNSEREVGGSFKPGLAFKALVSALAALCESQGLLISAPKLGEHTPKLSPFSKFVLACEHASNVQTQRNSAQAAQEAVAKALAAYRIGIKKAQTAAD